MNSHLSRKLMDDDIVVLESKHGVDTDSGSELAQTAHATGQENSVSQERKACSSE